MSWSEADLQIQLSTELDRSTTPPAVTTSDYLARRAFLDRANRDWSESYDWNALLKVHNGLVSTSTANASYAMPADFKKLDSGVALGGVTSRLLAVNASDNSKYIDTDKYVNLLGNESSGYVMCINAGTLSSGTSVSFTYFAQVTSLATTTSISPCPDPTFLVQRALYYIYKSKEDGRFPEAKAESDRVLARMIENENALGPGYVNRTFQTYTAGGFVIGRD